MRNKASLATRVRDYFRKNPRRLLYLSIALSIVTLISAYLIELFVINQRTFSGYILLNNADSLVLPLIKKSITHHEVFQWKFSSQLFIFPEGFLYAIASIFMLNVKGTLLLNGFLNILSLWALLYLIINQIRKQDYWLHPILATFVCVFVLGLMLLERDPSSLVLTQFLTTTYYGGVIIMIVFGILINLVTINNIPQITTKKFLWLLGVSTFFMTLTVISNPLLVVWYVVPLCAIVGIGFLVSIFDLKLSAFLLLPGVIASVLGMAGRSLFEKYIGASVEGYFKVRNISPSIVSVDERFTGLARLHYQQLEYAIVGFLLLIFGVGFLISIKNYTSRRPTKDKLLHLGTRQRFLMFSLGSVLPVLSILIVIVSGNDALRYFIPFFIIPPLCSVIFLSSETIYELVVRARYIFVAVALLISIIGLMTFRSTTKLASSYASDTQCLDSQLPTNGYSAGLASFWNARTLELDSHTNREVEQINNNLTVFAWMNNIASYKQDFSFVVVDKVKHSEQDIGDADMLSLVGDPSSISHCQNFSLYLYAPGTPEHEKLNSIVQSNLDYYIHSPFY